MLGFGGELWGAITGTCLMLSMHICCARQQHHQDHQACAATFQILASMLYVHILVPILIAWEHATSITTCL